MAASTPYFLGIDVGGTKVAAGVAEFPSGRRIVQKTIPTRPERGGLAVLADVARLGHELAAEASSSTRQPVRAVGLGVCELVDRNGRLASRNCFDWINLSVSNEFASIAPALIEADVRAAARAEALFGAGRDHKIFLYVTIGTGISSCLMLEGRPYLGATGATGTMASSAPPIMADAAPTGPLRTLEEFAAGPALVARYNSTGHSSTRGHDVIAAAQAGEPVALGIVQSAATALGAQLGMLVGTLDPEAVIIGGGLGLSDGPYWDQLVASTRQHIWSERQRALPILRAGTGPDAGWLGAAAAAWDKSIPNSPARPPAPLLPPT